MFDNDYRIEIWKQYTILCDYLIEKIRLYRQKLPIFLRNSTHAWRTVFYLFMQKVDHAFVII